MAGLLAELESTGYRQELVEQVLALADELPDHGLHTALMALGRCFRQCQVDSTTGPGSVGP
jgi:hypothetical protein